MKERKMRETAETCAMKHKHYDGWDNTDDVPFVWDAWECSSCGARTDYCICVDWDITVAPKFCPNCGKKIIEWEK